MMNHDIKRVIRAKNRLQRLEASIGGIIQHNADVEARKQIQKAIENLHEAEMILRKGDF